MPYTDKVSRKRLSISFKENNYSQNNMNMVLTLVRRLRTGMCLQCMSIEEIDSLVEMNQAISVTLL